MPEALVSRAARVLEAGIEAEPDVEERVAEDPDVGHPHGEVAGIEHRPAIVDVHHREREARPGAQDHRGQDQPAEERRARAGR